MSVKWWAFPPNANEIAAINANRYLYRTQNFQSTSPTWSALELTLSDSSLLDRFVVDPLSPGFSGTGPINGWFTTCGTQVWVNNVLQVSTPADIESEVPGHLYRIEDIFGTPVITEQFAFLHATLSTTRQAGSLPGSIGRNLKVNAQGYVVCISHYQVSGTFWVRWDPVTETWNTETAINTNLETGVAWDHDPGLWISDDPDAVVKARCAAFNPGGWGPNAQGTLYELLDWDGTWAETTNPNIDLGGGLGADFAVSPHDNPAIMYYNKKVLNSNGYGQDNDLYRSNGSTSPEEVAPDSGRPYPGGFSFSYLDSQRIVFGSKEVGQLLRSIDGGDNWSSVSNSDAYHQSAIASDGKALYAWGSAANVGFSNDFVQSGIQDRSGNLLSLSPFAGGESAYNRFVGFVSAHMVRVDEPAHDGQIECGCGGVYASNDNEQTTNPISLRKGEKRFEATDLTLNTPVGVMGFTRKYRQSKQTDTNFQFMGLGWIHNHKAKLTVSGTSPYRQAEVLLPNGGILKLEEASGNSGHFDALPGSNSELDYDSGQFTLTSPNGSTYVFGHELSDTTGVLYRVESRAWANGETWIYNYASDVAGTLEAHQLVAIDDGYGRGLQFSYVDNTEQFDDAQLWRVGDQDATGLDGSTPTGRYIEFTYTAEKSDGQAVTGAKALLASVRDVRGGIWTYDYYGQNTGETDSDLLNFMVERQSPAVDSDGDGVADAPIVLESVSYVLVDGQVSEISQSRGDGLLVTNLAFDILGPNGEQTTTEEVDGKTTTHYFNSGVYAGLKDPLGNRASKTPDGNYRPEAQQDANGNTTLLAWSAKGKHLDQVTDASGIVTQFDYNTNNTLNYSQDTLGRKTQYIYGDTSNPRQPTRVNMIDADRVTVLRQQTFSYDSKGRTLTETELDPGDGVTVLRQVTRSYHADTPGLVGAGLLHTVVQVDVDTPANNDTTTYTYDALGRVIKTQKSSLLGSCAYSYTVYDVAGNVLATACTRENVTPPPTTIAEAVALYDASDPDKQYARVTTHVYDELGRRVSTTASAGASYAKTSLTFYDALDRVWRTISNYQAQGSSAPGDWVWNGQWEDGTNAVISHGTDNDANVIADTGYNACGLVCLRRDVLGNVMLYGYDDAGRLVKTVQNALDSDYDVDSDPALSAYAPDTTTPDGDVITEQVYDAAGNLVQTVDALGTVTFTVYDMLNRAVKTVRSAKDEATIVLNDGDTGYDAANDPRSDNYMPSTDPDRDLVDVTEYDTMGRVTQTERLLEARGGLVWDVTAYVYDELDRQIRTIAHYVEQGSSKPADWVWSETNARWEDGAGNAIDHGTNDQNQITAMVYNPAGQTQATFDVHHNQTRYVYDGLDRQIRTIAHYVEQGSSEPADWVWSEGDGQWEYSTGNAVDHGSLNDQNLVTATVYDADGRVSWTRDAEGKRVWNVYDTQGRLVTTIAHYVEQGSSEPADWVWSETNARWEDGAGNPIQRYSDAANPDNYDQNVISTTVYDAQGRVQQTRDVRGNLILYGYNDVGQRVKTVQNALDSDYDMDSDPDLSAYVPAVGTDDDQDYVMTATETRDVAGRVLSSVDRLGVETRYVYDALGRRLRMVNNYVVQGSSEPTDWVWNETNARWEDGAGVAIDHGADNDQNLVSDSVYNKAGQVLSTRDMRGTQTAFGHDALGRRMLIIQAANSPLETSAYTCYDKVGHVLRSIQNWVDDGGSPDELDTNGDWVFAPPANDGGYNDRNRITTYGYDGAGRRVSVSDPVSNITTTTYGLDGQVDTVTDPEGVVTLFRYDDLRRTWRVAQNYISTSEDPARWVWDSTQWKDSGGTPISHGTDNDQNVIVDVSYDLGGRKLSQRDPRGNLTTYDYDQLGRRITLTNPLSKVWTTTYTDLDGAARTVLTDPKSVNTQRDFDRLGRLVGIGYGDATTTPDVIFSYDASGNRSAMVENNGTADVRVTQYGYDDLRRLTQVDFDTDGDSTVDESVSYTYDIGGRRTQLTLPGSLAVTYDYDAKGRLIRLTDWDGHATAYTYDNANRLIAAERHNGLLSRYVFDAAGRLRSLRHGQGPHTQAYFAYEVDGRGNRTQALELLAHPATTNDTTYSYDDESIVYHGPWTNGISTSFSASLELMFFGRDITVTMGTGPDYGIYDVYLNGALWRSFDGYAVSSGQRDIDLALEADGPHLLEICNRAEKNLASSGYTVEFKQLVVANYEYDLHTVEYAYDALARLVEARYNPGIAVESLDEDLLRHYLYTYDLAGNRLSESVALNGGIATVTSHTYNAVNQISTAGFTYDANGNLTSDGTHTYTWDRANRLTGMGGISYVYDGLGNRISQTANSIVTTYLLDTQPGLVKVLAAVTLSDTTRFVHGPRGIHAQKDTNGNWTWMLPDGLGSVRSVMDNALNVDSIQSYAPYGEPLEPGSFGSPFRFTGEQTDNNGLVYLRARYYHPALGVFTGLDPVENLNRYQYVGSNPTNFVDPSGMITILPNLGGSCGQVIECPNPESYIPNYPLELPPRSRDSYFAEGDLLAIPVIGPFVYEMENAEQMVSDFLGINVDLNPLNIIPGVGISRSSSTWLLLELARRAGNNDAANLMQHFLEDSGASYNLNVDQVLRDLPVFRTKVTEELNSSLGSIVRDRPDSNLGGLPSHCWGFQNTVVDYPDDRPWIELGNGYRGLDIYPNVVASDASLFLGGDIPYRDEYDWYIGLGHFYHTIATSLIVNTNTGRSKVCYRVYIHDYYDWDPNSGPKDTALGIVDALGEGESFEIRGSSQVFCEDFVISSIEITNELNLKGPQFD